jgi:hypothetical protein
MSDGEDGVRIRFHIPGPHPQPRSLSAVTGCAAAVGGRATRSSGVGSRRCTPRSGGRGIVVTSLRRRSEVRRAAAGRCQCFVRTGVRYIHFGFVGWGAWPRPVHIPSTSRRPASTRPRRCGGLWSGSRPAGARSSSTAVRATAPRNSLGAYDVHVLRRRGGDARNAGLAQEPVPAGVPGPGSSRRRAPGKPPHGAPRRRLPPGLEVVPQAARGLDERVADCAHSPGGGPGVYEPPEHWAPAVSHCEWQYMPHVRVKAPAVCDGNERLRTYKRR